jgi:hypothetical protein
MKIQEVITNILRGQAIAAQVGAKENSKIGAMLMKLAAKKLKQMDDDPNTLNTRELSELTDVYGKVAKVHTDAIESTARNTIKMKPEVVEEQRTSEQILKEIQGGK